MFTVTLMSSGYPFVTPFTCEVNMLCVSSFMFTDAEDSEMLFFRLMRVNNEEFFSYMWVTGCRLDMWTGRCLPKRFPEASMVPWLDLWKSYSRLFELFGILLSILRYEKYLQCKILQQTSGYIYHSWKIFTLFAQGRFRWQLRLKT